jgi:hypothetical protein
MSNICQITSSLRSIVEYACTRVKIKKTRKKEKEKKNAVRSEARRKRINVRSPWRKTHGARAGGG